MELKCPGSFERRRIQRLKPGLLLLAFTLLIMIGNRAESAEDTPTFEIRSFVVDGNTLMPGKKILELLQRFKGPDKTAEDVEKARDVLEKMYHTVGYPAVLVNIPEQ